MDDKIEGAAELSFAREVLGLAGDHVKVAGTPEALEKTAAKKPEKPLPANSGLKKLSSMDLREIFSDPNFRRGVMEEIESSRHIWEPTVEGYVRAYYGME